MVIGRTRLYADENIEVYLVDFIRGKGCKVDYAIELGFSPRDDNFHLQEARRRKCVLISRDKGYLNHRKFPFHNLKDTAIIVLMTEETYENRVSYGFMLLALLENVMKWGNKELFGEKIEIRGSKMIFHYTTDGQIKTDIHDIYVGG